MDNLRIKAKHINYHEPLEVTSIDFKNRTFTYDYRGRIEEAESFDYVESWEVEGIE